MHGRGHFVSPLEVFHPNATLSRVAVIGTACPDGLASAATTADADGLDAVILAPGATEWRNPARIATEFGAAAARLTPDGLAYVLVPPRRRRWARRLMRSAGLAVFGAVLHAPDIASSRYLVPVHRAAATYAFTRLVSVWPRRRRLVRLLLHTEVGRRMLAAAFRPVALLALPAGARTPYAWLGDVTGTDPPEAVVTTRRGRATEDRLVLTTFTHVGSQPAHVVKIADDNAPDRRKEAKTLERLGPAARAAGAEVPSPLSAGQRGRWSVLTETPLTGRCAADVLGANPRLVPSLLEQIATWLERWNEATRFSTEPAHAALEREVLVPLHVLGDTVRPDYHAWLVERCEQLATARITLVAAHRDLTMFNVLLGADGQLGIVDWEEACEQALPLTDLAYAAVDAVAAAARYRSRLAAFECAFVPGASHAGLVQTLARRVVERLGLSGKIAELALHACWLHHAANELQERGSGDGDFLQIVRRLAQSIARDRAGPS